MPRFIPPAGAPLRMAEVFGSLKSAALSNGDAAECLSTVAERFQVRNVFGTSSGRAALWLILRGLHRLNPDRDVVAIPAYTCFSVPAAVVRAGLRVLPLDVDAHNFELDLAHLGDVPDKKLLCVIGCNLFGFPSDVSAICEAAESKGAYVVDDAAQALGATRNGRYAGTLGDVGLYSLGRGKSMGSIEGGLIVTNSREIAGAIQAEAANLAAPAFGHGARLFSELVAYSVLLNPNLYWIPNSMPFLKLGATEFNPSFEVSRIHGLSAALLQRLLGGLDEVNEARRANAKTLTQMLEGNASFEVPSHAANSSPTFVRLPIIAGDKQTRDRAVSALRNAGIGATGFYPSAICDIPGIEKYAATRNFHREKAERLSQRLLTVPVSPFVTSSDLGRIREILSLVEAENR